MTDEILNEIPQITAILEPYGWFVAPFISRGEIGKLRTLASEISANPPTDDAERKAIEEKIHSELIDIVESSQLRARSVWLGLQTSKFNYFSHLYEAGVLAYYKREFPAAVLLLLAALEGILLAQYGWRIGDAARKPSFSQLSASVKAIAPFDFNPALNATQQNSLNALSNFVDNWLYKKTDDADFSLSVLNRHYVMHGLGPGNFYRMIDVRRLILFFDLLIEVMSMSQGIFHAMIDDDETKYTEREAYYRRLRLGEPTIKETVLQERTLLSQHPMYVSPF